MKPDDETLHAYKTVRQKVIFIGERQNWWWLVLACGHLETRRQPAHTLHGLIQTLQSGRVRTAPKEVGCGQCSRGFAPRPVEKAIQFVENHAPIITQTEK